MDSRAYAHTGELTIIVLGDKTQTTSPGGKITAA